MADDGKVEVRTTFRPDEVLRVNPDEAAALKARGLLSTGKTVEYVAAGVKVADAPKELVADEFTTNIEQVEALGADAGKQG